MKEKATKTVYHAQVYWWDEMTNVSTSSVREENIVPAKAGIFETKEDAEFYVNLWLNGHNGSPAGPKTEITITPVEVPKL